jgi:tetratricopeptide (TPR) repeat protein
MSILDYKGAREDADRALKLAPADAAVLALHGDLLRVVGRYGDAEQAYRAAELAGDDGATAKLHTMRLAGQPPRQAVRLGSEGFPGRALDILEKAAVYYRDSHEIKTRLADLYLFYGLPSESMALYRDLLGSAAHGEHARRGLQQSLEASELPSF